MTEPVSFDVSARRALLFAHIIFAAAIVVQIFGLALYGAKSTIFLEGLALGLFALWLSLFEGGALLVARRFPSHIKVQKFIYDWSLFFHLLFLGVTHGLTYEFFSGT